MVGEMSDRSARQQGQSEHRGGSQSCAMSGQLHQDSSTVIRGPRASHKGRGAANEISSAGDAYGFLALTLTDTTASNASRSGLPSASPSMPTV